MALLNDEQNDALWYEVKVCAAVSAAPYFATLNWRSEHAFVRECLFLPLIGDHGRRSRGGAAAFIR